MSRPITSHLALIRALGVLTVIFGINYVVWRWLDSVNWSAWWIALPLIIAETYSLIETILFVLTVWRAQTRPGPSSPPQGTVDVFVTTFDEPVDLVLRTAHAAKRIAYPHETWVLDDGARPELQKAADEAGIRYLSRSAALQGKPRHAKAGNLNNALLNTDGEFFLVLDADQVPDPSILDRTLGYFADDPAVAVVQTPQWFTNAGDSDRLGSQAPLFYGPIQQGKDGWNAAFFCGSNAVLRREALMQLGIVEYVRDARRSTLRKLGSSQAALARAARDRRAGPEMREELVRLERAVDRSRSEISVGAPVAEVTYRLGAAAHDVSDRLLLADRSARAPFGVGTHGAVAAVIDAARVDRPTEAHPVQPVATSSVTKDMATAMQLHALGWQSVYHHEVLARGLAPHTVRSMLSQRLRWAQGTMQVFFQDNPLLKRGLTVAQRLMYFTTMWNYLAGFAAIVYLTVPVIFLVFGTMPVTAWSVDFFARFLPYFVLKEATALVVARGIRTWRGRQYSLALFPVWVLACTSAFISAVLARPLRFEVTRKDASSDGAPGWWAVRVQLLAIIICAAAIIIGLARASAGDADMTATLINAAWVCYSIVLLSVVIGAARHRASADSV